MLDRRKIVELLNSNTTEICINCKTKEQAFNLLGIAQDVGYMWRHDSTYWSDLGSLTCYFFNTKTKIIQQDELYYAYKNKYKIYSTNDFEIEG